MKLMRYSNQTTLHYRLKARSRLKKRSVARAIAFVIEQPSDVAVNEMIIRPTVQVGK